VRLSVASGRAASPRPRQAVRATARRIENHLVRVSVGATGVVTLLDRRTDERYRGLLGLHDDADRGDLYTPSIGARPASSRPEISTIEVVARGPLVAALVVHWRLRSAGRGRMTGRTTLTLHAGSPTLRCRVDLDNRARDHRLRMRLPVGVSGPVVAGAGMGFVERPAGQEIRRPGEWQLATAPAHDFVAAGTRVRGLLLEHPGFFEYESSDSGILWVTLVRSVGELSRARLAARPGHAAWPVATPDAQEPGGHTIELALTPLSSIGSVRARTRVSPFDTVIARSLR
jgi:alpha-mannosidase